MRRPRIVFVMSEFQNAFFYELGTAFVDSLEAGGLEALVVTDTAAHAVTDDDVFVLLPPHEYVSLEGDAFVVEPTVAARTIGISAEQPHQVFFERNAAIVGKLGAVLDFSPLAVAAYEALGIRARHQPFGYVEGWDCFHGGPRSADEITTEVLYLGNKRPRRLAALADAADQLVAHRAVLKISDNAEPNRSTSPSFLAGADKRALLRSTRLLVNIHQSDEAYFEWLRFADAAHCGVPVLTERSTASQPFVDGEHFLSFEPGALARQLGPVLADGDRLDDIAAAAYATLKERPLPSLVGALVDTATSLLAAPPPDALPPAQRSGPLGRDRTDPRAAAVWRRPRRTALARALGIGASDELVAPASTTFREPLARERGALIATCMCDGTDVGGAPSLEGIWPWETWRLLHGRHLGRVMAVDLDVADAARRWITEPWVEHHRHVALQLFAAVHGIVGTHVPRPLATLHGTPVDPEHQLPADVAARCRQILAP